MMRSSVCSGTAIMVWTFCSTMLMRSLKASSSWASRTRTEDFSLEHLVADRGADAESVALVGLGGELIAFEQQQHAALRVDGLDRQIQDQREQVRQRPVLGQLLAGVDQRLHGGRGLGAAAGSTTMVRLGAFSRLVTRVEVLGESV